MTTLQKTAITATLAIVAGVGIYEARQNSRLREQNQTLTQERAPLAEQMRNLQKSYDEATNRLAALRDNEERFNRNTIELLKLRGEVARLKNDSQELAALNTGRLNDPVFSEAVAWRKRVNSLKQHFDQNPGARIPEMGFLTEIQWLEATKLSEILVMNREDDSRRYNDLGGMAKQIKLFAKDVFANKMSYALKKFLDNNAGELPTHLTQLKPHFLVPVEDEVLDRYELRYSGNVKDVPDYYRKCALVSEKKSIADASTQSMIRIGDAAVSNLSSY